MGKIRKEGLVGLAPFSFPFFSDVTSWVWTWHHFMVRHFQIRDFNL